MPQKKNDELFQVQRLTEGKPAGGFYAETAFMVALCLLLLLLIVWWAWSAFAHW